MKTLVKIDINNRYNPYVFEYQNQLRLANKIDDPIKRRATKRFYLAKLINILNAKRGRPESNYIQSLIANIEHRKILMKIK